MAGIERPACNRAETIMDLRFATGFGESLRGFGSSVEQNVESATQVSSSSQSLAHGAGEPAASMEETSASIEEIASITKRNVERATRTEDLAGQALAAVDRGIGERADRIATCAAMPRCIPQSVLHSQQPSSRAARR